MHNLEMEEKAAGNTGPSNRCTTSGAYPWEGRHATWAVLGVALLFRFGIGLHSYSGKLVYDCERHCREAQ